MFLGVRLLNSLSQRNGSLIILSTLTVWALTFPNVGWILTLRVLGNVFQLRAFMILHIVCCCVLGLAWVVLFCLTIAAFLKGFILNSKPEDVLEDSIFSFRLGKRGLGRMGRGMSLKRREWGRRRVCGGDRRESYAVADERRGEVEGREGEKEEGKEEGEEGDEEKELGMREPPEAPSRVRLHRCLSV